MNKIAFAAAAFLIATGSAFAGSDHYGSDNVNQPAVTAPAGNVDNTVTGSIRKLDKFEQREFHITPDQNQPQSGQGIWGR
ncbi:DUF680 domain-containing protein [Mesorhizobium sp. ESP-6-4]|uniref:DUF680 domain-containing protein n=1 Tax=unclassified Mesorhizobium TaxID=325217 RepID=UPI000BB08160|nr:MULTISPECIES: DUF680 domain-containing protein [unclassified Mesorhizobium]MBZ9661053.1 DUF680 domain-containing protein [Mesorhizobium sp. ESP-6-4]MBZ9734084.1 DUF680 domain-containing protein [Mesorhizobium sp. CA9]MBZ9767329.1 DUF680 domain-containing protein [Mesorhizobium sp. CA6]MBZ9816643.1 DUF680 domain-containing protein [Mesorhizobium sp. CA7]MBZ9825175.1 DUF680 domain-containing protein [Mesorhizobium sp. CA18]